MFSFYLIPDRTYGRKSKTGSLFVWKPVFVTKLNKEIGYKDRLPKTSFAVRNDVIGRTHFVIMICIISVATIVSPIKKRATEAARCGNHLKTLTNQLKNSRLC
jgi:hypothetical protein